MLYFATERRIIKSLFLSGSAKQSMNAEAKHQLVFQAYIKYGSSRVTLAARTPAQLVIYSHAFIHMCTYYV
ncbi:hypothetical protein D3C74_426660 [compost metagenome]